MVMISNNKIFAYYCIFLPYINEGKISFDIEDIKWNQFRANGVGNLKLCDLLTN